MRDSIFAKVANSIWGGGTETQHYTVFKLFWRQVCNELEEFAEGLAGTLKSTSESLTEQFRDNLVRESTAVARRHLGDDLDAALIIRTNRGLASAFKLPVFELNNHELRKLKGTGSHLLGNEARKFLDDARHLLDDLKGQAKRQIRHLMDDVTQSLPPSYGNAFFQDMQARIEQLEEQVGNALLTLDRLQRMAKELEAA